MSADELFNVVDAAQYLGIRPWTLRHWVSDGKIEIVKYGNGIVRIRRTVLGRFVASCTIKKAFFNWCIGHQLTVSNQVRRVKLFHEDNSRLRDLSREEYERLIKAARTLTERTSVSKPSPYLEEKIIIAAHTGLRRGSLFNLRWDQIDFANSVMRIPRTKSGRPLSVPLNLTAKGTLEKLCAARESESAYVFPHTSGPHAGEPVQDIKNGFHAALELAEIENFTWHDLRHTFASWLMMRGASLRSVAELLGHQSMKMTMR